MKTRTIVLFIFSIVVLGCTNQKSDWKPLLDINLSNWETYLTYEQLTRGTPPDPNQALSGQSYSQPVQGPPSTEVKPYGYNNDPKKVFSVSEENGELVLKITGEILGGIFTKQEFQNFRFITQMKWGTQKYPPRLNAAMDSGILYYSIGECAFTSGSSWMLAQEFQVCEGETGKYYNQWISWADAKVTNDRYDPNGTWTKVGSANPSENFEKPMGEWNTLELICFNGQSLHIVNGNVVMALKNSRYIKGTEFSLIRGKILLQSEAAEVYYKGIQIKEIEAIPIEYASYFN